VVFVFFNQFLFFTLYKSMILLYKFYLAFKTITV